jgi:SAM-dependent methyltransferase
MRSPDETGSWTSSRYVAEWTETDALADVLALPRRLAAALVADSGIEVSQVVDLGAGAGAFLRELLLAFPSARGVWVDVSPPMRSRAQEALADLGERVRFVETDLRDIGSLPLQGADVIVSSRVIHHFEPGVIRSLYAAAFGTLQAGGFLFNLDHFRAPREWDAAYRRVRRTFVPRAGSRRPHPHDSPPQPLEDHLSWLREAGFEEPDVPWRLFFTSLLAAAKPG